MFKVATAALVIGTFCCGINSASAKTGMVLTQTSTLGGDHIIYLQPNSAVRLFVPKTQVSLLAKAPEWRIILCNARSKKWCSIDAATFRGPVSKSSLMILTGQNLDTIKTQRLPSAAISGIAAIDNRGYLVDMNTGRESKKRPFDIFTFQAAVLPEKVASILNRFAGVPELSSLALRVVYSNQAGNPKAVLETTSVQNKEMAKTEFDVPGSFAKATKESDVLLDAEGQEAIEEMVKSMSGK